MFFFSARVPEGVLLIRAVSPATPKGSVSQTHIHKKYFPHVTHLLHRAHIQIHMHLLLSCCYFDTSSPKGSSLKRHISPTLLNPLQLPMLPLPEVPLAFALPHHSSKLTGDTMMPQTRGCMAHVKRNTSANP